MKDIIFLLKNISTYMTIKSKNDEFGRKLIHKNLRD